VSKSVYRTAADGMPARVSGGWAQTKREAFSNYLSIFNRATYKKWPHRSCIDLMAGCGKCVLKRSTLEFDGSPLVALASSPPFTSLIFVESDDRLFDALNTRTLTEQKRTHLIHGDCNDPVVIDAIRAAVPHNALSTAFVDNLGLDVTLAALKQLTAGRRIDLVITFQMSDIKRNVDRALARPERGARWDRFFGTPMWRQAVADFEAGKIRASDLGGALEDFYAGRLATIGYAHHTQLNRAMRNTRNAPLYRVMLFSKDPLAVKLFNASSASSGQRGLFC
jgi:three-Cys-motif partner protein